MIEMKQQTWKSSPSLPCYPQQWSTMSSMLLMKNLSSPWTSWLTYVSSYKLMRKIETETIRYPCFQSISRNSFGSSETLHSISKPRRERSSLRRAISRCLYSYYRGKVRKSLRRIKFEELLRTSLKTEAAIAYQGSKTLFEVLILQKTCTWWKVAQECR